MAYLCITFAVKLVEQHGKSISYQLKRKGVELIRLVHHLMNLHVFRL